MTIQRNFDIRNLVRELSENKVNALDVVREAISNAKDHGARKVWLKTTKDQRNEVSVVLGDDGEGMDDARLEAFWGVGASAKASAQQSIGYKGHGTKLYFDCRRLSVATRTSTSDPWRTTMLEMPYERAEPEVPEHALRPGDPLEVAADNPIHHFFDAIDVIICWSVGKVGDIYEESSSTQGKLRKKASPVLKPSIDTHEITYKEGDKERVIPVLEIAALFPQTTGRKKKS